MLIKNIYAPLIILQSNFRNDLLKLITLSICSPSKNTLYLSILGARNSILAACQAIQQGKQATMRAWFYMHFNVLGVLWQLKICLKVVLLKKNKKMFGFQNRCVNIFHVIYHLNLITHAIDLLNNRKCSLNHYKYSYRMEVQCNGTVTGFFS